MVDDGVLIEVDDDRLGETEERMLWEGGIWKHYCSANGRGLQSVLRGYLDAVVAVAEGDGDGGDVGRFDVTGGPTTGYVVGGRGCDYVDHERPFSTAW